MRKACVLTFLLAATAVLVAVMPGAARGTSTTEGLAQATNAPYLAWVGETVNVERCLFFKEEVSAEARSEMQASIGLTAPGTFTVEQWSGENNVNAGPKFIGAGGGTVPVQLKVKPAGLCWSTEIASQIPGLAQVKLNVELDVLASLQEKYGHLLVGAGDVQLLHMQLLRHQFLVAWMTSTKPAISEIGTPIGALIPGDPAGDGIFKPIFMDPETGLYDYKDGLVKVVVKGTFPYFGGATMTMPDSWPTLAGLAAVNDDPSLGGVPGSAAADWDIHGSFPAEHALGPFDPLRDSTLLGDGHLTAADAPMPAIRLDVNIAAGGAGSLEKASKEEVYVDSEGVLFEPFYKALIPPAGGGETMFGVASGISGALYTGNYPGFLEDGVYHFWTTSGFPSTDPARAAEPVCRDELGAQRPVPFGYDHVAVYTDEHGQAFVQFNPDTGFNFVADANNTCDLQPATQIGAADITATAIYPDQPVLTDPAKTSDKLHKSIVSMASKTLKCVAKNATSVFCVEEILDIRGNPVAGAEVSFATEPQGALITPAWLELGGFDTTKMPEPVRSGEHYVVLKTGENGQAGVEIMSTLGGQIDVSSENLGTRNGGFGVMRDRCVRFGGAMPVDAPGPCAGGTGEIPTGPPPAGPQGPAGPVGAPGTPAVTPVVLTPPATVPAPAPSATVVALPGAKPATVAKTTVEMARLIVSKTGKFVRVKVTSPSKTAKIRVSLLSPSGKAVKVVTRSVKTNAFVRVANLAIPKGAAKVRVVIVR